MTIGKKTIYCNWTTDLAGPCDRWRRQWSFMQVFFLMILAGIGPWSHASATVVVAKARQDPELLRQLNADIWQPIGAAFGRGDLKAFGGCFADTAIMASGDMPSLSPAREFLQAWSRRFMLRSDQAVFSLEHRFTERAVYAEMASERGILAESRLNSKGEWERSYREFHAISRHVNGRWRIESYYQKSLQSPDSSTAFEAAAAPEDLARF